MVYMFADRFAPLVADGQKRQTIRMAGRRRPPAPGESLSLRRWTGKAYRSAQEVLRVALCLDVRPIRIEDGWRVGRPLDIEISGVVLNPKSLDQLARDDGFADARDMADWWRAVHTLPFDGNLIRWRV